MGRIHLGRALRSLPRVTIQVLRETGGYVDGHWRDGGETLDREIRAIVQPAKPQELQHLPGGEEVSDAILIHSHEELATSDESLQRTADHVRYQGRRYKVIEAGDWSQHGFKRYIAGLAQ